MACGSHSGQLQPVAPSSLPNEAGRSMRLRRRSSMAQTDVSRTSNETGAEPSGQPDEPARAFTSRLSEEASGLGSEAKQLAEKFAEEARSVAQTKASSSQERAARGLGSVAEALRNSGDQLRSDEQQ